MTDTAKLEAELREGLVGVTPGPWTHCSKGCQCTTILNEHGPVADVTKGEWGDEFPSLRFKEGGSGQLGETSVEAYMERIVYGDVSVETAMRNRSHIARCSPDNILALLDTIATLRHQLSEAVRVMEPFKAEAQELPELVLDDEAYAIMEWPGLGASEFTAGDVRAARTWLDTHRGEPAEGGVK